MLTRETWAQIDLDALQFNIETIQQETQKPVFAVVKANAYGCGDEMVASVCEQCGVAYFVVSSMDEGIHLRKTGIKTPILVLSYTDPRFIDYAKEYDLTLTVPSLEWVQQCEENNYSGCKVHIKVDTGMNRVGIKDELEVHKTLSLLNMKKFEVEGIFSHYVASDDPEGYLVKKQFTLFNKIVKSLNYPFKWIHCDNSDGALHYPDSLTNAVRIGIALYGILSYKSELKPVLSLYTKLIQVKKVQPGETIGYGATYTAKKEEWIGTLPVGYADGWLRRNQDGICVVKGKNATFVGRVCMDQSMIRLTEEFPIGTTVELIGPHISLKKVAYHNNTIPYEIMTSISDRVTRVYQRNKETVKIINYRFDD